MFDWLWKKPLSQVKCFIWWSPFILIGRWKINSSFRTTMMIFMTKIYQWKNLRYWGLRQNFAFLIKHRLWVQNQRKSPWIHTCTTWYTGIFSANPTFSRYKLSKILRIRVTFHAIWIIRYFIYVNGYVNDCKIKRIFSHELIFEHKPL